MKSICLIPARGGSKRIHKKNIRSFAGKPLIGWSIECALNSGIFADVYVSTDDLEIKRISESFGAKVPFIRPKEISNDFAKDSEVRNHFINWLNIKNINAEILCYLYATAPFINKETLEGCRNLLIKLDCSCVFTITEYEFSPAKALCEDNFGRLSFRWNKYKNFRSQDLPKLYHDAGQCYFYNLNKKDHDLDRFGYKLSRLLTQDIDTEEDFKLAEYIFKSFNT